MRKLMSILSRGLATFLVAVVVMVVHVGAQTRAPDRPRSLPGTDAPSTINRPFQNPDVPEWVQKFESESREVYTRRDAIVKAMGLKPGMAVADIGAGTGLFTRLFADRVGPEGKVFAVDISPPFLAHIASEAKKRGQSQVQTVQGTQDSSNLPADSIDVAFLCDTYHHIEHPGRVLASIRRALRPGGRLVVIDFDRREGISTDFVLKHIRADKARFLAEITAAGFEPVATAEAPRLAENFFAAFRKAERSDRTP
jgi:ubiquinone/menaquinone biosynthesis C-methylase UbiE